jgi:hemoglobin-like flavoprotein
VRLLRSSFEELGPTLPDVAARFYDVLFERAPELRSMFSVEPVKQEALFAAELSAIVEATSRFAAFVARTRELGARHATYGVTHEHYGLVGGALLVALGDTLGATFTVELRDAWRLAFDLIAETMMQGAGDAF